VISVGGTHLVRDGSARGFSETAWSNGGSACSLSIAKPAYQSMSPCGFKATTDIAAVGDPQTGMAIYNAHGGGWTIVGGTSAAAPIVASIFAATGNGAQTSGSFVMSHAQKMNDVISGSNGTCGTMLCDAGTGWDGPTGFGTPNGNALVAAASGGGSGSGSGSADAAGGGVDQYGDVTGGCAAGGGAGGGATTILVLGALVVARRRNTSRAS
jgi:MYXO-CTERM domain-containing protein